MFVSITGKYRDYTRVTKLAITDTDYRQLKAAIAQLILIDIMQL